MIHFAVVRIENPHLESTAHHYIKTHMIIVSKPCRTTGLMHLVKWNFLRWPNQRSLSYLHDPRNEIADVRNAIDCDKSVCSHTTNIVESHTTNIVEVITELHDL